MNPVLLNQLAGTMRAILPVVCTLLVAYNVLPKEIADQLPDAVTALVIAAGSVASLAASAWSWWSNRPTAVAKQAATTTDAP